MNIQKASSLFAIFYLVSVLLGSLKQVMIHEELRTGLIEKENFLNGVKVSTSHAMDDFRDKAFNPLAPYSYRNLENSIYQSEERYEEMEKNEVIKRLEKKAQNDKVYALYKGGIIRSGGIRRNRFAMSKLGERVYLYGYRQRYHKSMKCKGERARYSDIFSSMEEAAKKGYFPCEDCILNLGR